jgi:hypothetical protein
MNKLFKQIQIGGIEKEGLIQRLVASGIKFNDYAKTLLKSPYLEIDNKVETFDLVRVNLSDLNIDKPCPFKTIVEAAAKNKLSLCPLALGLFLRLQFLDQPEGPYITIASKNPTDDPDYPNGFYVRNIDGVLWLRGYRADDDYLWPIDSQFIFIRRK